MTDKKTIILSSICIVLLTLILATVLMLNQKEDELQLKIDALIQIENDKTALESQVSSLDSKLKSANNKKSALESKVLDFKSEVTALETDKTALQSQVSDLQTEITTLQKEVTQNYFSGFDDGKVEGYQKGLIDGAGSTYDIRDPTYAEAMAFVDSDQTDKKVYSDDYVCVDFAADFNNNALNAGFRVGFVYIEFPESAHAIVCFDTLDSGLIFVEPQSDDIVTLTIGEAYWDETIHGTPDFDDTVVKYVIIW